MNVAPNLCPPDDPQLPTDSSGKASPGSLARRIAVLLRLGYRHLACFSCIRSAHSFPTLFRTTMLPISSSFPSSAHGFCSWNVTAFSRFLVRISLLAAMFLIAGVALGDFCTFIAGSIGALVNQLLCLHSRSSSVWIAGFAFFFGRGPLRNAQFPLAFLLLTIPIPDFLLDKAIYLLQKGSAEIAAVLFDWSGVPVLRDGFVFHLAHVSIEVARECSGIRSSLALLILAILVAHFYLDNFWKQVVLVLAGLFVMILKNGVRIVTLTLLASYVDPGFLYGRLHHEGGVVFFLLGLLLLAPLLWLLAAQRTENSAQAAS